MRIELANSRSRVLIFTAALLALVVLPGVASAAPKKVRIGFSSAAYSVNEAETTFNVTVVRGLNTRVAVDVDYSLVPAKTTATAGLNYDFTAGTLHFAAGETRKTFPVTIHHDGLFSPPNKTVGLKLTNIQTTPATPLLPNPVTTTTLTILDSDGPGTIDFGQPSYSVVESVGLATITVTRNTTSPISESVDYTTTELPAGTGHATTGTDYSATAGTVTFAAGELSKTFTVPIADDSLFEGDETLHVTLSNPQNLTIPAQVPNLGPNSPATLTIVDDDVPTFSFSSPTYSVNEANTTSDVTVTRGGATYVPADVVVTDLGTGSAVAGTNYGGFTPQTLHFAAGETSKPFTVTIKDDGVATGSKTVDLGLSLGGTQVDSTQLSILDRESTVPSVQFAAPTYSVDEAAGTATLTVSLTGPAAAGDVTVHYATADDTATAGSDYTNTSGDLTIAQGQRSGTVTVPIAPDTNPEDDETFTVTLTTSDLDAVLGSPATATVTIADDDSIGTLDFSAVRYDAGEAAGHATITVNRAGGSAGPASVDYATSDGTASAPGDYTATSGTLSFADGETQKTIQIPIAWDGRREGDETVSINLSNFNSDDDPAATEAAVLHIADDGASGPVQFGAGSYDVSETAGVATITVNRSGGSLGGPVTVSYATSDATAKAGTDYTATSGTLTFGPGQASRTFQVPVKDDKVREGGRSVKLALSNPGGGTALGGQSTATLNIGDNEPVSSPSKDRTAPRLTLTIKKLQKVVKTGRLTIKVHSNEAAKLSLTANARKGKKLVRVSKGSKRVGRGKTVTITLELSKTSLRKLTAALVKGHAKITLKVTGTDAAGNRRTVRKTVSVR